MMNVKTLAVAAIALGISATSVALQTSNDDSGFQIVATKNCQTVYVDQPNQSVLEAYRALKDDEASMRVLEAPIRDLEDQIQEFTDQIESLTEEAVIEDDDRVIINKHKLEEQKVISEALETFMQSHQHSFDALSDMGDTLSEKADDFERAIEDQLDGVDYDQLHLYEPGETRYNHRCVSGSQAISLM